MNDRVQGLLAIASLPWLALVILGFVLVRRRRK